MTQDQIDTINIVQEVLRGIMLAITTQPGVDIQKLAITLQAASANENTSPLARNMLANLAEWPDELSKARKDQH